MKMWTSKRAFGAAVAMMVIAGSASGEILGNALTIRASSSRGTGEYVVRVDDGQWDGDEWFWGSSGRVNITDPNNGNVIASFDRGSLLYINDPQISLNWAVTAGQVDTEFTITSGVLDFDDIASADARATSAITLTESTGDTARLTGLQDGGSLYRANYNGAIPGGTVFTLLNDGPFSAGAFSSEVNNESFGFVNVGFAGNMQAQYSFRLTAGDQASATGTYVIIPAPAGASILALAGLATLRRRR